MATEDTPIPENAQPSFYLKKEEIVAFNSTINEADLLASQTQPTGISNIGTGPIITPQSITKQFPAPGVTEEQVQTILANGVTPDMAESMFVKDISRNESEVKKVLASVGVKTIPQGAFDGLVSMQNQLGDITYAFVKGEKIDLTGLYRIGAWDRVASFIAADDRDRPRRIREATMIARNDYGPTINPNAIIKKGFDDAKERLAKEQLNKQTGKPPTGQQTVALANNYFATNQTALPNASTPLKLASAKNFAEEYITKRYKRQIGPWPY